MAKTTRDDPNHRFYNKHPVHVEGLVMRPILAVGKLTDEKNPKGKRYFEYNEGWNDKRVSVEQTKELHAAGLLGYRVDGNPAEITENYVAQVRAKLIGPIKGINENPDTRYLEAYRAKQAEEKRLAKEAAEAAAEAAAKAAPADKVFLVESEPLNALTTKVDVIGKRLEAVQRMVERLYVEWQAPAVVTPAVWHGGEEKVESIAAAE